MDGLQEALRQVKSFMILKPGNQVVEMAMTAKVCMLDGQKNN